MAEDQDLEIPPEYDPEGIPRRVAENRARLEREDNSTLLEHAADLEEIQRHREWRIAQLEVHSENLDRELQIARARAGDLEEHVANLEAQYERLVELREGDRTDADNLRTYSSWVEEQLESVQSHVVNLERRARRGSVRLSEEGIFPHSPDARTEALFRAGTGLRREREDVMRRFPDDAAPDYWYWLLDNARELGLAEHLRPAPPSHLTGRVVGEENHSTYFKSGLVDWRSIDDSLRRAGFNPNTGGRILDFGAGCGRILQCFALYAGSWQLHGADVDDEAMRWCRRHLDFAHFTTLERKPPTDFSDQFFDAIYAFSVFSHLPEALHLEWLDELARITRPGAALVLTTQGRSLAEKLARGEHPEQHPKPRRIRRSLGELERGFLFIPYEKLRFQDAKNQEHFADWDLGAYGSTFIVEGYVREHWTQHFEVVDWLDSPDDWQDHVVLRRR